MKNNLDFLLKKLDFLEEEIRSAAAEQPGLFEKAARYRVDLMREKVRAKMLLQKAEAELSQKLREVARETGEKVTENSLSEQVCLDSKVTRLQEAYDRAVEAEEYAILLLEAFRMRRDSLRVISSLVGTELAMKSLTSDYQEQMSEVKKKLRARYPGAEG
jgi:aspartate/glutamate racemase